MDKAKRKYSKFFKRLKNKKNIKKFDIDPLIAFLEKENIMASDLLLEASKKYCEVLTDILFCKKALEQFIDQHEEEIEHKESLLFKLQELSEETYRMYEITVDLFIYQVHIADSDIYKYDFHLPIKLQELLAK